MLQTTNDVGELVELCAGLPLPLRIAGAVASRGSVAAFVSRMRRTGALATLAIDDDAAVSSAFQTSYDVLDPAVERGFRLLSLFPGQEFAPYTAEALLGPTYDQVPQPPRACARRVRCRRVRRRRVLGTPVAGPLLYGGEPSGRGPRAPTCSRRVV
jgi:hypothetical protein